MCGLVFRFGEEEREFACSLLKQDRDSKLELSQNEAEEEKKMYLEVGFTICGELGFADRGLQCTND